ncbi:MAG: hypothetical protein F9K29_24645 [Hyphomicrobiaceae bacterium]|nr:MAG: hypothetical protein F9K29_24645 [Hyphomicrobiaceae bacterium]
MHNAVAREGTGNSNLPYRRLRRKRDSRRIQRRDRLIASAVLVLLIAGWAANFVDARQLASRLNDLLAAGYGRLV